MDFHCKNSSFRIYKDYLNTRDYITDYNNRKIPKLNKYAEMYLDKLEKEKENKEIDNIDNINDNINFDNNSVNDNNPSAEYLFNDLANNNSNINANKIKNERKENGIKESNNFKNENYLAIDKLKKDIQKKSKKMDNIPKVNDINIIPSSSKVTKKKRFIKNIPKSSKNKSSLFFDFNQKSNHKFLSTKYSFCKNEKSNKNNELKIFFRNINITNSNRNSKNSKKKIQSSPLAKSIISSSQGKFYSNYLISNFLTENSSSNNIINKNNKNRKNPIILNDYWREKEIKNKIKLSKIKKEKIIKEFGQLRDKPKINKNSVKIVERLGANNTINVFDRLSKRNNIILFNERKINKFNKSLSNQKQIVHHDNSKIYKKDNGISPYYENYKQIYKKNLNNKSIYKPINKDKQNEGDQNKRKYKNDIGDFSMSLKIMCDNNLKKTKTSKINNKYINIFNNIEKTINFINTKESFRILNDNNSCINNYNSKDSKENIYYKNPINLKINNNNKISNNFIHINPVKGNINCRKNKINNLFEESTEKSHKIKSRKIELLKFLDFSTHIGINKKSN